MNDLQTTTGGSAGQDASRAGMGNALDDMADFGGHAPEEPLVETDEEAELMLPGYAIAFEKYHEFRAAGATPEEALQQTMMEWRGFWNAAAYVPHRRSNPA